MQKKRSINKMFLTIIGILLAIIFVAPILILVNSSFKTLQEIYIDILALPEHFSFQNYLKAFEKMDFLHSLINSLVITCVATVLILLVSSMAAWVMVRYKTKVSKVLFIVFSAALLIPFQGKTLPWVMGGFPSGYEPKAAADFQGYFSGEYTFDQMVDQLKADFVELKK